MTKKKNPESALGTSEVTSQEQLATATDQIQKLQRELEAEAALERFRARMLMMQKSSELEDVTAVMYQQLAALGIVPEGALVYIVLVDTDTDTAIQWIVTDRSLQRPPDGKLRTPLTEHPRLIETYEAWKRKDPLLIRDLSGDELQDLKEYYKSLPSFQEVISEIDQWPDRLVWSEASFSHGTLGFISQKPLPEATLAILVRFAKDFDLAYIRFLDLQKAEAQAREAQIEAALEKVRSCSLAMHKSDELQNVVNVVFQMLQKLDFGLEGAAFIGIPLENSREFDCWIGDEESYASCFRVPYHESPSMKDIWDAFETKVDFHSKIYSFEEKNLWFDYAFHHTDLKSLPEENKQWILEQEYLTQACAFAENSLVGIHCHFEKELSENEIDILKRFSRVFEQGYVRFLDLQKAEAQAREAQIEAALEKVRSRSLAMHKSDELREIVQVVFEKMKELHFAIDGGVFIGTKTETFEYNYWVGDDQAEYLDSFTIPRYDAPTISDVWEAIDTGVDFISKTYSTEEKNIWFEYAFKNTEMKTALPDEFMNWILAQEYLTQVFAFQKNSSIGIHFHHKRDLTENEIDVLKRFSRVFEQGYVRFLDLQKAEAQAREAQIEAALEKVRSRSLAIHKTDELEDVISLVFEKLRELNVTMDSACILTFDQAAKGHTVWAANPDLFSVLITYVPYNDDPIHKKIYDLREDGQDFMDETWTFEEKNMMYEHFFENTDWKYMPDDLKKMIFNLAGWGMTGPMLKHSATLLVSYSQKTYSEHEKEIIKRFGNVFEQAYIRYLDLQKAEEQAREAQIEAALERIRSRSMAMQFSGELMEVVEVMYDQVDKLGIAKWGCMLLIFDKVNQNIQGWFSEIVKAKYDRPFDFDNKEHEIIRRWWDFWESEMEILSIYLKDEEKHDFTRYLFTKTGMKEIPDEVKEVIMNEPEVYFEYVNMSCGIVQFVDIEPFPQESLSVLKRITIAFEQAYIRFLDIQKAEAQTRESQIQLALERVRARTMAMQQSDELAEASQLLVKEVASLGIPTWGCAFHIFRENDSLEWFSREDGVMPTFIIPREEAWLRYYDACKRGETLYIEEYAGEVCTAHYEYMAALPSVGEPLQKLKAAGIPFPTYQIDHVASFKYGYLLFITFEPVPEAHDIFKRFAKVFEQTYTRFLDLEKVQAQAKETVKQASLDRVRGEIASMRSTDDLQRITPLVWNELHTLGVPFIRCGVFIIHEKQENVEAYLSAPDGHSLGVLNLSFDSSDLTYQSVVAWRKGVEYKQHWNRQDFINWTKSLEEEGKITDRTTYQGGEAPPESLDLHFVPFTQGMLYVGNINPLEDEEINLVRSLAEAFAIAYARYEDFVQIENTLSELKSAQSQLIQSEKMASLGELTAGIAHEIQNPLNFVNNFSEVSSELIIEAKEELDNGDIPEAKEILVDLTQNLEKINHHGHRASSIVKGMLDHSRTSTGDKVPTDMNRLCDEYLRLAYHGLRAKDRSFSADYKTKFDESLSKINIIPQDMGRVLLNLINNAFYACTERSRSASSDYQPQVMVSTRKLNDKVEILVQDNGPGIPEEIKEKVFQPFFTTKPTGEGTGLGLSLVYDIIKAHGGTISLESTVGEGTEFTIQLPNV